MNTSTLLAEADGSAVSPALLAAARQGARIAFELLRSPLVPARLLVTTRPLAAALADAGAELAPDVTPADATHAYTRSVLILNLPAIAAPGYLKTDPSETQLAAALAYCAGYAAAAYVADLARDEYEGWRGVASPLHGADWMDAALWLATIASGFRMRPRQGTEDPYAGAARYFLRRATAISAIEGTRALWTGALGKATTAFAREVRFGAEPDTYTVFGETLEAPAQVHALVRFTQGQGPWPVAAF